MRSFNELGVGEKALKAIAELGFEQPTPIQEQAIPVLLTDEKDFVGLAQTGTGKTAAFGLPLIELVDFHKPITQALVLAPTRELCVQISKDMMNYSKYHQSANIVAVYGGASIDTQIRQIRKGAQIIAATPGRLIDLIHRKAIRLETIRYVVLDEADEMLNMGFQEDIDEILSHTPKDKKVWLFSATMPAEVRSIASNYMTNPFELTVGRKNEGAENIEHHYYVVHERDRYASLKRILDAEPEIFGIIFCRTKIDTQRIAENLIKDGYNADSLHGDLSQQQRDKVMARYRSRTLQMLVATDVAARGIDVNDVTHVIHYNLPDEAENYLHRSGRTARAGKSGVSVALVNVRELDKIRQVEKRVNKKFHLSKIPTAVDVCEQQLMKLMKKIHDVEVNEKGIAKYLPSIFEELHDISKEDLIQRVVSIEFNRFLDYYRNAPDLNVDIAHQGRSRSSQNGESYRSSAPRMFINLGSVDGFDRGNMLDYVMEMTGATKNQVGKIDIKGVYSFIEMEEQALPKAMESFRGEVFNGRKVRVEISGDGERKSFDGKKSKEKRGWGEKSYKRNESFSGDKKRKRKYAGR
ncbi:MAG: DEAD/DEAH box helicase [Bacteroidetes bacterium]|nr:DEAD/DEAH box helicase [Bacteroidota bacterium]